MVVGRNFTGRGMSLLVAKPKVGKTTLAFNIAIATARGGELLGRSCARGAVVYLALEEKKGEIKKNSKRPLLWMNRWFSTLDQLHLMRSNESRG